MTGQLPFEKNFRTLDYYYAKFGELEFFFSRLRRNVITNAIVIIIHFPQVIQNFVWFIARANEFSGKYARTKCFL